MRWQIRDPNGHSLQDGMIRFNFRDIACTGGHTKKCSRKIAITT